MKVIIDSIEISGVNRWNRMEAEIEFNENSEVIQEFGVKECLEAIDSDDWLNEIGWDKVKAYFTDEIQEIIDAETKAKDEEIESLTATIAELES